MRLNIIKTEFKEYIFLNIKVQIKYKKCRLHTLLDSDIQRNFIFRIIILEEDIIYEKIITHINEVEDYSVIIYEYKFIKMHITDI